MGARKIYLAEFIPTGFSEFRSVVRLVRGGQNLEHRIRSHFMASNRGLKASHRDYQKNFLAIGPLKINYNSFVAAQNFFNKTCTYFAETEKVYGSMQQIQDKLNKLQGTINSDTAKITQIENVFHALESEYKSYIQDLDDQVKVPVLKFTISDNRPMFSVSQMNEIVDRALRCAEKVQEVTSKKHGEYSYMTIIIDQIAVTMIGIQNTMTKFQPAEVLE